MTSEQWKPILGYEGEYEVSNIGRVRNAKTKHMLAPHLQKDGYPRATLSVQKRRKTAYIHRFVAEAFMGACPQGMEVNHINCIRDDNRAENLEYLTHADNNRYAYLAGNQPSRKGELNPIAKAKWTQVREIRRLYALGEMNIKSMALKFNLSRYVVSDIVRKKRWIE